MRSIGFYSFKGGVGRSNLLMNVAYHLAAKENKHVGILDLDLEAPGLSIAPPLRLHPDAIKPYPDKGLMDFFDKATEALLGKNNKTKKTKVPNLTEIFYETALAADDNGSIHLAPAVPFQRIQSGKMSGQNRGEVYHRLGQQWASHPTSIGEDLFSYMLHEIENNKFQVTTPRQVAGEHKLDFLLTDLRTGMTELADTSAGSLFNELVIVSGLNTQNITGLFIAIRALAERCKTTDGPRVSVTPIFSPIPNAELLAVRDKIKDVANGLTLLKKELDQDKNRLRIFLPDLENWEATDGRLHLMPVIHYCDYLALYDEVLLEKFPETQTARDLKRIATRINDGIDEVTRRTSESVYKMTNLEANQDETIKVLTTTSASFWSWLPDFFAHPPGWRWPLDAFAQEDFDVSAFTAKINKGFTSSKHDIFLDALAASISVGVTQKAHIINNYADLSQKQRGEILRAFSEERNKFIEISDKYSHDFSKVVLEALCGWLEALKILGARLVPATEMIVRIASGKINVPPVPQELLPLLCLHKGMSTQSAVAVADAVLVDKQNPEVQLAFLQHLSTIGFCDHSAIGDSIAKWTPLALARKQPPEWSYLVGESLIQLTRYSEAHDFLHHGLQHKPHARAWNIFGNLLKDHLNRHGDAEKAYRKAINLDRNLPYPWHGLGNLLRDHFDRYDEAEDAYRKAISLDPKSAYPWDGLGTLLSEHLNRCDEAEEAYRKAIDLDPKLPHPWVGLGSLLKDHLSRFDEAEDAFRNAIRLDSKTGYPWICLGSLLQDYSNRYGEAEEAYRKAIEIGGMESSLAFFGLLRLYSITRQDSDAALSLLSSIDKFFAAHPEFTSLKKIWLSHGVLLAITSRISELKIFLREIKNKQRQNPGLKIEGVSANFLAIAMKLPQPIPMLNPLDNFRAVELEYLAKMTALLAVYIPEIELSTIQKWLRKALRDFKWAGDRKINWKVIAPALKILDLGDLLDERASA